MTPEEKDAFLDEVIWPAKNEHDIMYYHRDGTPCKTRREAFAVMGQREDGTPDSHWVAYTHGWRKSVSTIFLCMDHSHNWGDGPSVPLIFETMVFPAGDWGEEDMDRYPTEAAALEGHERLVAEHLGERALRRYQKHGSDDRWKQTRGRWLARWVNLAIRKFHTSRLWRRLTLWLEPWLRGSR